MADLQEPHSLASTFPNPPPFWKNFTPAKIARIETLRNSHGVGGGGVAAMRVPGVPDDLINLQPPPEPVDGRWRVFGDQYMLDDKLPTLEEQGIANLSDPGPPSSREDKHFDRAFELKRLAKSLLLNFLELSGTLAHTPSSAEAKIQDLRTLFINMHHILNEYRPHQARESAIEMMQDHLDRTRAETVAIRTQVDKTRRVLEGLGSLGMVGAGGGTDQDRREPIEDEDVEELATERDMLMWAATDAAFA
ncbi:MED7 protein [Hirsutella rhossiliensis]|uniref:Mediator of RNA polymerase II transcription subunit 7 n=1 Tax=Hirsutella rhossiliensis TaxID=111463 RepID=A0A9P8MQD2_9HYPO|nr:MED7 protein [Hirsutella rhossiliensis]KAH0958544.1 MED7 protein [Hirsutella rhossiliensis]